MFDKPEQLDPTACPPWQLLLGHAVQAERLTRQERDWVVEHIGQCQALEQQSQLAERIERLICVGNGESLEQSESVLSNTRT